jgi:hypothetical protein
MTKSYVLQSQELADQLSDLKNKVRMNFWLSSCW